MVPLLDQVFRWRAGDIRDLLERYGLTLQAWDKARSDHVQLALRSASPPSADAALS
jgi:hypothetical protein